MYVEFYAILDMLINICLNQCTFEQPTYVTSITYAGTNSVSLFTIYSFTIHVTPWIQTSPKYHELINREKCSRLFPCVYDKIRCLVLWTSIFTIYNYFILGQSFKYLGFEAYVW